LNPNERTLFIHKLISEEFFALITEISLDFTKEFEEFYSRNCGFFDMPEKSILLEFFLKILSEKKFSEE